MIARLRDTLLLIGGSAERAALRKTFEAAYDLLEAESVSQGLLLLKQNAHCIAAVLADVPLGKKKDMLELAQACRGDEERREVPLMVFIDGKSGDEYEEKALGMGADSVVRRPFAEGSLRRRVQVVTELYHHRWQLEKLVEEQRETIRRSNQVMLDALSTIIEHRSTESGKHVLRIRRFTQVLLQSVAATYSEYGLTPELIDTIASAAALHDIGKISIPDDILNKPGRLTAEEFEVMKTHTTVGGELVHQLAGIGDEEFLRYAYNIALYHHERWDGKGYPVGLKGDDIPICAQVVGLADAYDALTTERTYKKAYSCATAVNMILNGECGAFSPELYECFKRVRREFAALAVKYADGYSPKADDITAPLPKPVWNDTLNATQLVQMKYQTLMHYTGDIIVELNMDDKVFHTVYNPDVVIEPILANHSIDEMMKLLMMGIHPEDRAAAEVVQQCFEEEFFTSPRRRVSCVLRLFSMTDDGYRTYRITVLKINTRNEQQRSALMVLHRIHDGEGSSVPAAPSKVRTVSASPAVQGLLSHVLCCEDDGAMTICSEGDALFALTGYTDKEIRQHFGGSYAALVCDEDRPAFIENVKTLCDDLRGGELEYRLITRDGMQRWVLDKCRAYLEEDGQVHLYHALTDHSHAHERYRRYEEELARSNAIIEMSNSIVFEWDLDHDNMYCSPKWREHFGYEPISKNYGAQMGIATHFHPDDLPIVREGIRRAKEDHEDVDMDVRIADKNAKYLWTHIAGQVQLDDKGALRRIIGVLLDVDAAKRAEMALREKAERDALTQLFNKETARQFISEAITDEPEGSLSALLVLDLDNFKGINDNYGHLYGDAVLTQIGTALKRLFRENDIIGRVGGDEFVVYMRNIPSVAVLENRCDQLLETFRGIMDENAPSLQVSCSVGVSLFPEHGRSYTDLFRHADEALYHAKSHGKDCYSLYDPALEASAPAEERAYTAIDSDHQPILGDGTFVQFVFHRLYESRDTLATIDELLRYIGEQLDVDRVYIFENNADNTTCSNTFEWCNEGITPEKENLQNVSYLDEIAGWENVYDENGVFYCTDIEALEPHFRAILEPQGIKSMLQCAIYENNVFRGYVGFDDCTVNRLWTKEQIRVLQFLAELLAMFLLKKRAQDAMEEMLQAMRAILDHRSECIYLVEPESYTMQFINEHARAISPKAKVGEKCYRALLGRDSPCTYCPIGDLAKNGEAFVKTQHSVLGEGAILHAEKMDWQGRPMCLMTLKKEET